MTPIIEESSVEKEADRDAKADRVGRFLEQEMWPQVPPHQLGRVLDIADTEEILGYGPDGF